MNAEDMLEGNIAMFLKYDLFVWYMICIHSIKKIIITNHKTQDDIDLGY